MKTFERCFLMCTVYTACTLCAWHVPSGYSGFCSSDHMFRGDGTCQKPQKKSGGVCWWGADSPLRLLQGSSNRQLLGIFSVWSLNMILSPCRGDIYFDRSTSPPRRRPTFLLLLLLSSPPLLISHVISSLSHPSAAPVTPPPALSSPLILTVIYTPTRSLPVSVWVNFSSHITPGNKSKLLHVV